MDCIEELKNNTKDFVNDQLRDLDLKVQHVPNVHAEHIL